MRKPPTLNKNGPSMEKTSSEKSDSNKMNTMVRILGIHNNLLVLILHSPYA